MARLANKRPQLWSFSIQDRTENVPYVVMWIYPPNGAIVGLDVAKKEDESERDRIDKLQKERDRKERDQKERDRKGKGQKERDREENGQKERDQKQKGRKKREK
eukprot:1395032-Amorphochlora_amoeboformis.AAC.1